MLNLIIAFSLKNRLLVLLAALALAVLGGYQATRLPVDVFPDLNRPTVVLLTEAPNLAPEEVESLVTRPIEYVLNGTTGVRGVRSSSAVGLSVVWVEFDWDTDVYKDRQVVTEKLQQVRERLPRDANPTLAPISSIMGEILLVGLRSRDGTTSATELRTLADFTLRNRLLAVEGVSQVTVIGGSVKQYQVVTSPNRLAAQDVTLDQLVAAAEKANAFAGGGVLERSARESLIRIRGRVLSLRDVEETPVLWRGSRPVLIRDVADVRFGGATPRVGDAGLRIKELTTEDTENTEEKTDHGNGKAANFAVILTVQKQPHADTLTLDRALDTALDELQGTLPAGVSLERHVFRQADFIAAAVRNVEEAIRDGALWVFVILFLFLWNVRTSVITLTAIPLSVLVTALVFRLAGASVNTMTLGGIAVAVGELVDDAVVDVENIYRRLKEWRARGGGGSALDVIFAASSEVRGSVVYATLIVCLVVTPLFALAGLEGRLFAPLGLAYVVSLLASLLVSLTVTPALAAYLLPRARFLERPGDPLFLRALKGVEARLVRVALRRPNVVLGAVAVLVVLSVLGLAGMGGEFLPPFNEGTITVNAQTAPGTSLVESNRVGSHVEELLLQVPEVLSVARRTGRAEMDEHAEGVHSSELDVRLAEHEAPKPGWAAAAARAVPGLYRFGIDEVGRPRDEVLADVRARLAKLPGVKVNVGQPISHRLDHMMSGVRAQVAVKVFGPDLAALREAAHDVEALLRPIPGVTDLQIEPQVEISQVRVDVRRREAAEYGLAAGDVARLLETAYQGRVVSEILDDEKRFALVVRYDEASRGDVAALGATRLHTPSGRVVALDQVAAVVDTTGPNQLNRENLQRRVVVSLNVRGRDLAGVVGDVRAALAPLERALSAKPGGYRVEYGGQFEAQQQANARLLLLGSLALAGVFLLLCKALESWRAALQVLVNVPLAAVGSVAALLIVNRPEWADLVAAPWWDWPRIWLAHTSLSVAHWVGFITLVGIVSRNGIMMISHYLHLMRQEGEGFTEAMIVRGTLERLAPVLMTAGVTVMGLVPLALGAGQTGKEILHPLAVVVIGGLIVSTLLDQVVTPALFFKFGAGLASAREMQ